MRAGILILMLALTGCASTPAANESLVGAKAAVTTALQTGEQATDTIQGEAELVSKTTAEPYTRLSAERILSAVAQLRQTWGKLTEALGELGKAQSQYEQREKQQAEQIAKLQAEKAELEAEGRQLTNGLLGLVVVLSVVALGVGVYRLVSGSGGLGLIAGAVVTATAAITVMASWNELALYGLIVAGALLVALVGFGVWQLIQDNRKKEKALTETVKTVEQIKPKLSEADKVEIFGAKTPLADEIQSEQTKLQVKKIRKGKK